MTERNDNPPNSAMEDALRAIDKFWEQSAKEGGLTHAEWFEGMYLLTNRHTWTGN